MALSDHVVITVRRVRSAAAIAGFGVGMALDAHRLSEARTLRVGSLAELEDLGASATDTIHRLATVYFAQSPAPQELVVGRRDTGDSVYVEVDNVAAERLYEITIGGLLFDVTSAPTAAAELVAGKLVTEIQGGYEITAVAAGLGGTFTILGDHADEFVAGQTFDVNGSTNNDAAWEVASSVYTAPSTIITVIATQNVGAVADGHIGGMAVTAVSVGDRTFTTPGDVRARFTAGLSLGIRGSTGNDNNSGSGTVSAGLPYVVESVALVAGDTVITIDGTTGAGAIPSATADGGIVAWADGAAAGSTVVANVATWDIAAVVAGAGGTFAIPGNVTSFFPAGTQFRVTSSVVAANNGLWTVASSTYTAPNTVITVIATQTVTIDAGATGNVNLPLVLLTPDDAADFYSVVGEDDLRLRFSIANSASADLTTVRDSDDAWYVAFMTTRLVTEVASLAAAIEAVTDAPKQFSTASGDANIVDTAAADDSPVTGSVAARMAGLNYLRTSVTYSGDDAGATGTAHTVYTGFAQTEDPDDPFVESAIWGKVLPSNPGSTTFKFQELSGIVADDLTSTQRTNALAKNCNVYANLTPTVAGFEAGTTAEPEWIDIVWGLDWLRNDVETRIFGRLWSASNAGSKVPYTDQGAAVIEAELRASVALGIERGVLAASPAPVFTRTAVANQAPADSAARRYTGLSARATAAGAIHIVDVTIEVEV